MGAAASVPIQKSSGEEDEGSGAVSCALKGVPSAIENAIYVHERWPLIVDPTEQAGRFLRYQRGSFLMAESERDMERDHLRQLLVGALKNGSMMTICFATLDNVDFDKFFVDGFFPAAVLNKVGRHTAAAAYSAAVVCVCLVSRAWPSAWRRALLGRRRKTFARRARLMNYRRPSSSRRRSGPRCSAPPRATPSLTRAYCVPRDRTIGRGGGYDARCEESPSSSSRRACVLQRERRRCLVTSALPSPLGGRPRATDTTDTAGLFRWTSSRSASSRAARRCPRRSPSVSP